MSSPAVIDHFHGTFPIVELYRNLVRASRDMRGNQELLGVPGGAIAKRDSDINTNTHNYRVT